MTEVRHAAVRVPATTANLGPGFDSFGAALSLHLWARSVDRDGGDRVSTTGEGERELPGGDDNLLWRSLVAFCDHAGAPVPDVAVRVRTDIPLERGLGSSSSAIVAGLALGRWLTGEVVGDLDLVDLATELEGHPDNVAPAVLGGLVTCVVSDRDDLVVRRAQPAPRLRPIVLVPTSRQLTTEARAVLPETLSRGDVAAQAARAGHVVGGLLGAWPVDPAAVGDLLHEPARLRAMEATGRAVAKLRHAGVHAWLSGAGPSVAAAVPGRDDSSRFVEVAPEGFEVRLLDWDLAGVVTCPDGGCAWSGSGRCVQCPRDAV